MKLRELLLDPLTQVLFVIGIGISAECAMLKSIEVFYELYTGIDFPHGPYNRHDYKPSVRLPVGQLLMWNLSKEQERMNSNDDLPARTNMGCP
jgi:hypothetical protein